MEGYILYLLNVALSCTTGVEDCLLSYVNILIVCQEFISRTGHDINAIQDLHHFADKSRLFRCKVKINIMHIFILRKLQAKLALFILTKRNIYIMILTSY